MEAATTQRPGTAEDYGSRHHIYTRYSNFIHSFNHSAARTKHHHTPATKSCSRHTRVALRLRSTLGSAADCRLPAASSILHVRCGTHHIELTHPSLLKQTNSRSSRLRRGRRPTRTRRTCCCGPTTGPTTASTTTSRSSFAKSSTKILSRHRSVASSSYIYRMRVVVLFSKPVFVLV